MVYVRLVYWIEFLNYFFVFEKEYSWGKIWEVLLLLLLLLYYLYYYYFHFVYYLYLFHYYYLTQFELKDELHRLIRFCFLELIEYFLIHDHEILIFVFRSEFDNSRK